MSSLDLVKKCNYNIRLATTICLTIIAVVSVVGIFWGNDGFIGLGVLILGHVGFAILIINLIDTF